MKRGTPEHPKLIELCDRMSMRKWEAVGVLESLWHLCCSEAPNGDLGRLSDKRIVLWLDLRTNRKETAQQQWERILSALVETRWIDPHPGCRFVIHDWKDHANDPSRMSYRDDRRSLRWQRLKAAGGELATDIRSYIFLRGGNSCKSCGTGEDLTIDHVFPISKGGTNHIDNLQVLCRRCNSSKKDRVLQ